MNNSRKIISLMLVIIISMQTNAQLTRHKLDWLVYDSILSQLGIRETAQKTDSFLIRYHFENEIDKEFLSASDEKIQQKVTVQLQQSHKLMAERKNLRVEYYAEPCAGLNIAMQYNNLLNEDSSKIIARNLFPTSNGGTILLLPGGEYYYCSSTDCSDSFEQLLTLRKPFALPKETAILKKN